MSDLGAISELRIAPPRRAIAPWRRSDALLLSIVLLFAIGVRAPTIARPFHRNSEGLGSFYGILARNYFRHRFTESWGVPIQSIGVNGIDPPRLYAHHPPLLPLFVAASYAIFGDGEWQTRLPSALFTIACVATIFVMVRARAGLRPAAIASFLFAAVPISILYGGQPDVINAQLVFFILLTVAAYLRFHERPSIGRLLLLTMAFTLAAFTDWPAFFIVPVLCLQYALTKPLRSWAWIVAFGLISVLIFAGVYAHISLVAHDWRLILEQFHRRSMEENTDRFGRFTWQQWFIGIATHNYQRHTLPVLILGGGWVVLTLARWRKCDRASTMTRILLGWALLHVLIGRQGVLVHDWWWWPLTPGLVIAAALMLDEMARWVEARAFDRSASNLALMIVMFVFGATFAVRTIRIFYDPKNIQGGIQMYSIAEIGHAIRAAAGPNEAVVVAEKDDEPALWYYADRPIKWDVWDEVTLANRMHDGYADLVFKFRQQWTPPPKGFVFPKAYERSAPRFVTYLKSHFALTRTRPEIDEKFYVFDLTRALLPPVEDEPEMIE